jgi:hypothetical protein
VAERRAQHDGQARQIHGGGGGGQGGGWIGGGGVGVRMQRSLLPGLWAGLLCCCCLAETLGGETRACARTGGKKGEKTEIKQASVAV